LFSYMLLRPPASTLFPYTTLFRSTALALATLAIVKLVGSDGILAVFIAGLAFNHQIHLQERLEEEYVVEGLDRFFTAPVFILLRSEEHTSELQSRENLVCRLLLEK